MAINSYSSCRQQNPKSKSKTYKSSSPILYIFTFTIHNKSLLILIIISKFSQLLSTELSLIRKLASKFDRGDILYKYILFIHHECPKNLIFSMDLSLYDRSSAQSLNLKRKLIYQLSSKL